MIEVEVKVVEVKSERPAFKVGDVVRIKSGGPPMTVSRLDHASDGAGDSVTCVWHDGTGYREQRILACVLEGLIASVDLPSAKSAYRRPEPTSLPGPGERAR